MSIGSNFGINSAKQSAPLLFMGPLGHGWYGEKQFMHRMWSITCEETYWFNEEWHKWVFNKQKKNKSNQIMNTEGCFYDPPIMYIL